MAAPPATVAGRVASVNERGFRLEGSADWLNYSKFARDIVFPKLRDDVVVSLDERGFVRCVEIGGGDSTVSLAPKIAHDAAASHAQPSGRDVTITRLAVLKAAAEFGAARPSYTSSDILKVAAAWERWVTRSTAPRPDDDNLDGDLNDA